MTTPAAIPFRAHGRNREAPQVGRTGKAGLPVVLYRYPSRPASPELLRVNGLAARKLTVRELGTAALFDVEAIDLAVAVLRSEVEEAELLLGQASAELLRQDALEELLAGVEPGDWLEVPEGALGLEYGKPSRRRVLRCRTAEELEEEARGRIGGRPMPLEEHPETATRGSTEEALARGVRYYCPGPDPVACRERLDRCRRRHRTAVRALELAGRRLRITPAGAQP